MSSIRKELLIVSSIILMSWHGSRNWDFNLIQLEREQYVLAGVCYVRPTDSSLQKWGGVLGLWHYRAKSRESETTWTKNARKNWQSECYGDRQQRWHWELTSPMVGLPHVRCVNEQRPVCNLKRLQKDRCTIHWQGQQDCPGGKVVHGSVIATIQLIRKFLVHLYIQHLGMLVQN
jgi:hypothetical protein